MYRMGIPMLIFCGKIQTRNTVLQSTHDGKDHALYSEKSVTCLHYEVPIDVAKEKQCFLTAVIQGIWKQFLCPLLPLQKDTGALQSSLMLYGLSEEVVSVEIP